MRQRAGVCISIIAFAGVAHADDKPINLLTSVPTTIAVSSTVDNAAIKPEHIADGKLETAWNSRTDELTPHVLIRVPADAKVTSIKLTAGFTKIDKKLGDLFTMNPRIKKVRVSGGGKTKDFDLDITNRTLQELTVDMPGGDIDIAVLTSELGSKKKWREISISELEVWGTTKTPVKVQKPAMRLRSLDALPVLTKAECAKAVGKLEGRVVDTDEIATSADFTVCRLDTKPDKTTTHVTLAAVSRATKKVLGTPLGFDLENKKGDLSGDPVGPMGEPDHDAEGTVELDLVALRLMEQALQVTEKTSSSTMYSGGSKHEITLYRVDATGLVKLVQWATTNSGSMESNAGTTCTGPTITPGKAMPKKLTIECVEYYDDYHNEDHSQRGRHETPSKQVYVWNGTEYIEK